MNAAGGRPGTFRVRRVHYCGCFRSEFCMLHGNRFPSFKPHHLLRNPHAQTLAAVYLPGAKYAYSARQRRVRVSDGDQIVLHDDRPTNWQRGDRVAVLVPGLGGCHSSGYMQRIAAKLNARGVRTFRMDQRGWGAGFALARRPFHGARYADLAAAVEFAAGCCPDSPSTLIGFSLGANIALNLCSRYDASAPVWLDSLVAVCPPLDVGRCVQRLAQQSSGLYDRHFVSLMLRQSAPEAPSGSGIATGPASASTAQLAGIRYRVHRAGWRIQQRRVVLSSRQRHGSLGTDPSAHAAAARAGRSAGNLRRPETRRIVRGRRVRDHVARRSPGFHRLRGGRP